MADEAVCVWDVNDPTRTTSPQLALRGHTGEINALAKLADGRLASGGEVESDFDLVVRDLTGQNEAFVLLDYALNLSPALRDTITRDIAQNVSTFEPRLPRGLLRKLKADPNDASLREGSVQPKAAYLLQPPKARE